MKKLFAVLFIAISVVLLAELTEIKTMTTTQFTALKGACVDSVLNTPLSGNDEVITFYHDKLIDPNRDGGDDFWREDRASYEPINKFSFTKSLSYFL